MPHTEVDESHFPVPDVEEYKIIDKSVEMVDNCRHYTLRYSYYKNPSNPTAITTTKITRIYELHNMPKILIDHIQKEHGNFDRETTWQEAQEKAKQIKINQTIMERRKWAKFGDALGGVSCSTVSEHDVYFELTNPELRHKYSSYCGKFSPDDTSTNKNAVDAQPQTSRQIVCKYCNGSHWSHKCLMRNNDDKTSTDKPASSSIEPEPEQTSHKNSKYLPPHSRGKSSGGQHSNDKYSSGNKDKEQVRAIKLNNLAGHLTQNEVKAFCESFGRIYKCVYKSNSYGGYAYVTYTKTEVAELAIAQLNGQRWENTIISAEWANH